MRDLQRARRQAWEAARLLAEGEQDVLSADDASATVAISHALEPRCANGRTASISTSAP